MKFSVLGTVLVTQAFYLTTVKAQNQREERVLTNEEYFNEQNIVKALNKSRRSWVYGVSESVDITKLGGEYCIFLYVEGLTNATVNLKQTYEHGGEKKPQRWNGTFNTLPGWSNKHDPVNRTHPNNVVLHSASDSTTLNFTLVYSLYGSWSLFYGPTKNTDCVFVVDESKAATENMRLVKTRYGNVCGDIRKFKKLYNTSCIAPPKPAIAEDVSTPPVPEETEPQTEDVQTASGSPTETASTALGC